jgi:hypothetical protein
LKNTKMPMLKTESYCVRMWIRIRFKKHRRKKDEHCYRQHPDLENMSFLIFLKDPDLDSEYGSTIFKFYSDPDPQNFVKYCGKLLVPGVRRVVYGPI